MCRVGFVSPLLLTEEEFLPVVPYITKDLSRKTPRFDRKRRIIFTFCVYRFAICSLFWVQTNEPAQKSVHLSGFVGKSYSRRGSPARSAALAVLTRDQMRCYVSAIGKAVPAQIWLLTGDHNPVDAGAAEEVCGLWKAN